MNMQQRRQRRRRQQLGTFLLYACGCILTSNAIGRASAWKPRVFSRRQQQTQSPPPGHSNEGSPNTSQSTSSSQSTVPTTHELNEMWLSAVSDLLPYSMSKLRSLLLYKPPVGIVTVFVVWRLILSARLFRVTNGQSQEDEGYFLQPIPKRHRRYDKGFTVGLDSDDQHLLVHGGVEGVRRTLCLSILKHFIAQESTKKERSRASSKSTTVLPQTLSQSSYTRKDQPPPPPPPPPPSSSSSSQESISPSTIDNVKAAFRALSLVQRPRSSRVSFVQKLAPDLEKLNLSLDGARSLLELDVSVSTDNLELHADDIVHIAGKLAETRALDAILRSCRDRLLRS